MRLQKPATAAGQHSGSVSQCDCTEPAISTTMPCWKNRCLIDVLSGLSCSAVQAIAPCTVASEKKTTSPAPPSAGSQGSFNTGEDTQAQLDADIALTNVTVTPPSACLLMLALYCWLDYCSAPLLHRYAWRVSLLVLWRWQQVLSLRPWRVSGW